MGFRFSGFRFFGFGGFGGLGFRHKGDGCLGRCFFVWCFLGFSRRVQEFVGSQKAVVSARRLRH